MDLVGVLLVFAFILIGLGLLMRWRAQPKRVELTGLVAPPSEWLAEALRRSCKRSLKSWSFELLEELDATGEQVIALRGELTTDMGDRIVARAPTLDASKSFTEADPYVVLITMQDFQYRSHLLFRILAGKYPEDYVVNARDRLLRNVKKVARAVGTSPGQP